MRYLEKRFKRFLVIQLSSIASFSNAKYSIEPNCKKTTAFIFRLFVLQYTPNMGLIESNSLSVIYISLETPSHRFKKSGLTCSLILQSPYRNSTIYESPLFSLISFEVVFLAFVLFLAFFAFGLFLAFLMFSSSSASN